MFSIYKHVILGDAKIIVLDDGTPQVYLDKIIEKYSNIEVNKSEFYEEKVLFTIEGKKPEKYSIPIDFWVKSSQLFSENFILIEDDTWFINDMNLEELNQEILQNKVVLTKLYWVGNPIINQNKKETQLKNIVLLKPKLYTTLPALYYFIFYKFNRLKIRKTLRFLKIHTNEKHLAYYTIYAVAGMVFNKNYFQKLWNNHSNTIDEGLQLFNAVKIYNKQKSKIKFARYKHELLRTGFMSSATNQNKESSVDMFVFNKLMNESWLHNQFDVIQSLPKDIDKQEIIEILNANPQKGISSIEWANWVENFKSYYLQIGCKID